MRVLGGLLALVLPLLLPLPAVSAADVGRLEVQSASVTVRDNAFEFNVRTIFPLNDDVRTALSNGATVNLDLQAVVERKRRYWLDATLVDVILRRELSWNAVSQRYILKDTEHGEQESFSRLDEALVAAGVVRKWRVSMASPLDLHDACEIQVRAGYRRGRLPDALRALVFWSDGWNRRSKWYSWTLPR
jgi:hypothetical protein